MSEQRSTTEPTSWKTIGSVVLVLTACYLVGGVVLPAIRGVRTPTGADLVWLVVTLMSVAVSWVAVRGGFQAFIMFCVYGAGTYALTQHDAANWYALSDVGYAFPIILFVITAFLLTVFPAGPDGEVSVRGGGYIGYREVHEGRDGFGGE